MRGQRFRKRAQQAKTPRIDPAMAALEQQRVPPLFYQLSDEISVAGKRPARSETARAGPNEVDVAQRTGGIPSEEPALRTQQNQLFILNDWDWRRVRVVDREHPIR